MALLGQYAPTWLAQLPWLLSDAEQERLQRQALGTTPGRMVRELAEAVDALTAERPLVLWLEDLHWSDYSTLDVLSALGQRRERARLLVLGTYRPEEVLQTRHPLGSVKQTLQERGQCEELCLPPLTEAAVREHLAERFAKSTPPDASAVLPLAPLARLVHRRTDGNPLFMVTLVEEWSNHGGRDWCASHSTLSDRWREISTRTPGTLHRMIAQRIERLTTEECTVLEAASLVGAEFPAAAVAAGIGTDAVAVEQCCAALARREQFLRCRGTQEWPDGTVTAYYGFLHGLYQAVLSRRVPAGKRVRLHKRIGERLEDAYSSRTAEVAGVLAAHFAAGREYRKAVCYCQQAAEQAIRRCGYREAVGHLTK